MVWLMQNTNLISIVNLRKGALLPAAWNVVTARDFNRDGYPDILLRQDSGKLNVWQMRGTNVVTTVALNGGYPVATNLALVATQDFNRDGSVDFLWQAQNTGALTIWYMNKYSRLKVGALNNMGMMPATGWSVVGGADLEPDTATKELLWHSNADTYYSWSLEGTNFVSGNYLFGGAPLEGANLVGAR
jgi:hypothetical protein